jgi:hypothetical protein
MTVNVNEKIRKLSTSRRRKVETRAAEWIAEEMTLRELRLLGNISVDDSLLLGRWESCPVGYLEATTFGISRSMRRPDRSVCISKS